MPSQADVKEIGETVEAKRRFDKRDWDYIADYVIQTWEARKSKRRDLERHWDEIDRQVAMQPDVSYKKIPDGNGGTKIDAGKLWMSEIEPPLQAQALEVLVADARRMMFPDTGPWFRAHAETTDDYLDKVNFKSLILGDQSEVPSIINQDNADKLVEGFLLHNFRQNDLFTRYDRINAEAFKYGMGIGRARMETKNVYIFEARGVRRETQRIPVLVPASVRNCYLDDPMPSMHSAQALGPAHIAEDWMRLENLKIAANAGSVDPDDPDGGWMPKNIRGLEANKDGYVQVLEMEGDLVVPRETVRSVVIPGAIVTVAVGAADTGGNATKGVIRFRFRKQPFSTYLLHPYHYESATDTYPTSPLMKGRPVQITVAQALNRLMDSAALKNAPPVGYDRNDMNFAQTGGPVIHPYAQWPTTDELKVYSEIGGDPGALAGVLTMAVNLYSELTGVLPARLGAQTVSHTTAYAKNAELERGATRTVDYVTQTGHGPVAQWLDMSYQMARGELDSGKISFFIDAYGGFVEVSKEDLPERAVFEWFGSGGPVEEQQKKQMRLAAANFAMQLDAANVQLGGEQQLDIPSLIQQVLREGGWTDTDTLIKRSGGGSPADSGALPVALQQLGIANAA